MSTLPIGTGNSDSTLRQVIERLRLANTSKPGEAQAAANNFPDLLELVARTVDETVLPRNYTLTNGTGHIAMLTISNRRLFGLRFNDTLHPEKPSGASDADELAGDIVNQLRSVCKTPGPYQLHLHSRAENLSAVDANCSAASLRKASSIQQGESRLASFSSRIQSMAEAWLYNENTGKLPQCRGPADIQEKLVALEEEIIEQINDHNLSLRTALAKPSLTILPFCHSKRVVFALDKQNFILAIISEAEMKGVTQLWTEIFGIDA